MQMLDAQLNVLHSLHMAHAQSKELQLVQEKQFICRICLLVQNGRGAPQIRAMQTTILACTKIPWAAKCKIMQL
jgi:hypothetical protein